MSDGKNLVIQPRLETKMTRLTPLNKIKFHENLTENSILQCKFNESK